MTISKSPPKTCECCGAVPLHWVEDYSQETNVFRGWICETCNSGIKLLGDNLKGVMNDYPIRRFLKHQGKAAKSGLSNKVISSAMNGRSYSKGKGTSNAFWGDISETLYQRTGNRDSKRLNNLRNLMRQMEGMYDNINLLEDAPEVSLSVQE